MSKKKESYLIYLSALVNLVASLAMLVLLRRGTPIGGSATQRMEFIQGSTIQWVGGWLIWMAAAVFLVLFFALLRENLLEDLRRGKDKLSWDWVGTLVIALASAGMACDMASEALSSTALVTLSDQFVNGSPANRENLLQLFAILDRVTVGLTGFLGNGLYSVAGILLNLMAFQVAWIPRWLCWLGIVAWLMGFALSVATLLNSAMAMMVTTAILMPLFILWSVGMGYFYVGKKDNYQ